MFFLSLGIRIYVYMYLILEVEFYMLFEEMGVFNLDLGKYLRVVLFWLKYLIM